MPIHARARFALPTLLAHRVSRAARPPALPTLARIIEQDHARTPRPWRRWFRRAPSWKNRRPSMPIPIESATVALARRYCRQAATCRAIRLFGLIPLGTNSVLGSSKHWHWPAAKARQVEGGHAGKNRILPAESGGVRGTRGTSRRQRDACAFSQVSGFMAQRGEPIRILARSCSRPDAAVATVAAHARGQRSRLA